MDNSIEPKVTRVTVPYRYTSWTLEGHPDMLPGDLFAEFTAKACQLGSMLRAIRKVVESPLAASDDGRDNGPLLDLIEVAADLVDDVYGLVHARQEEGENDLRAADESEVAHSPTIAPEEYEGRAMALRLLQELERKGADACSIEPQLHRGVPQDNPIPRYLDALRARRDPRLDAGFGALLSDYISGCLCNDSPVLLESLERFVPKRSRLSGPSLHND